MRPAPGTGPASSSVATQRPSPCPQRGLWGGGFSASVVRVSDRMRRVIVCCISEVRGRCVTPGTRHRTYPGSNVYNVSVPFVTQGVKQRILNNPIGVFTLVTRRQNFDACVKNSPLGVMLTFDARVKILSPRHQCENP